jgi:hypothetical protein
MYSADARLEEATRLAFRPVLSTTNGGIPVRGVMTPLTRRRNQA